MNQVHELIYQCFIKTPDKVAVIDRESVFTYNDLWKNVCRIGCWLSNNYEQGSRIAIMLDNSIESVLFVFGASFAKMISVPIDTNIHQ